MEKLVPLINEIHDIMYQTNLPNQLELPQIVVIGSQSVGKSSVLESIIGRDFLPRGKGIVTRRPIEIHLTNYRGSDKEAKEWAEFAEKKDQKFQTNDEIRKQIIALTEAIVGTNKAVSSVPIKIKFYSPRVPNLLLVDLPGMTKNPVEDQPKDIEFKIKELIYSYIKNPNSLILAVSLGTDDLANSEALKVAREVDPKGDRTMGVLTQLDLVTNHQDILNDLLNKTYHLTLGYFGIVCRSQRDIENSRTIEQQTEFEKKFFDNHKTLSKHSEKLGIPFLVKSLNLNFINQIKKSLPSLRGKLVELKVSFSHDLSQYGNYEKFSDSQSKGLYMLTLINKFCRNFSEILRGNHIQNLNKELEGGSRINYILFNIFKKSIDDINPFENLTDEAIRTAIRNSSGLKTSFVVNDYAFEILIKKQIMRLLSPSIECSRLVFEEIKKVYSGISLPEIDRFEKLKDNLSIVLEKVLIEAMKPTEKMIKNMIDIELGHINMDHPDFCTMNDLMEEAIPREEENKKPAELKLKPKEKEISSSSSSASTSFLGLFSSRPKAVEEIDKRLNVDKIRDEFEYMDKMQKKKEVGFNLYEQRDVPLYHLKRPPIELRLSDKVTKKEQTEINIIKTLITKYFNIVKKNIADAVPKTIIALFVNKVESNCERELISELYQPKQVDELMEEDSFIAESREETKRKLMILEKSAKLLSDIEHKFDLN